MSKLSKEENMGKQKQNSSDSNGHSSKKRKKDKKKHQKTNKQQKPTLVQIPTLRKEPQEAAIASGEITNSELNSNRKRSHTSSFIADNEGEETSKRNSKKKKTSKGHESIKSEQQSHLASAQGEKVMGSQTDHKDTRGDLKPIWKGTVKPKPLLFSSFGPPLKAAAEELSNAARSLRQSSVIPTGLGSIQNKSRNKTKPGKAIESPNCLAIRPGTGAISQNFSPITPLSKLKFTTFQASPPILPPRKSFVSLASVTAPELTQHKSRPSGTKNIPVPRDNTPTWLQESMSSPLAPNAPVLGSKEDQQNFGKPIEGSGEDWEVRPGRIRARVSINEGSDDEEAEANVAFSSSYILSKKRGIKMGSSSFRIFNLDCGHQFKLGGQDEEKKALICSVAKGKVQVKIEGTDFSISEGGMFKLPKTQQCIVWNPFNEKAAVHVVGIDEN